MIRMRVPILLLTLVAPLHADRFVALTARPTGAGADSAIEISAACDLPDGTLVTVEVDELWPAHATVESYEGIPPSLLVVASGRVEGRLPTPGGLPPGRYEVRAWVDPAVQSDEAAVRRLARRAPPPPVVTEAFPGAARDALERAARERGVLEKDADATGTLMDELASFARERRRSGRDEARMKERADTLFLAAQDLTLAPRPPFVRSARLLHGVLNELLAVIPAPMRDETGRPLPEADPEAVFAGRRIEAVLEAQRPALAAVRTAIVREHAAAWRVEVERTARKLAAAWRKGADDPRGWEAALRDARLALDDLRGAAPAGEPDRLTSRLQSMIEGLAGRGPGDAVPMDIDAILQEICRGDPEGRP